MLTGLPLSPHPLVIDSINAIALGYNIVVSPLPLPRPERRGGLELWRH